MAKKAWWENGVRFECQGSGKCCTSRGSYGWVYLTLTDRRRLAAHLGIPTREFTRRYCQRTDGHFHLRDSTSGPDCLFLRGRRCGVYSARPIQCRTWPFWPENMSPKAWNRDVVGFCPGVGKGKPVESKDIRRQLRAQERSESAY
jgi:Fe-S-cluster containining protein